MSDFEALGRDAAAAAHSLGDAVEGKAVLAALDWFGDGGANHLLHVQTLKSADTATITVSVKERDVYVLPVFAVPEPATAPHDLPPPAASTVEAATDSEPATAGSAETTVTVTEAPDGTEVTPAPAEEPEHAPEAAA